MMDYTNKLVELIKINNGIISTKMVSETGIPRIYISKFVKENIIERLECGIYASKDYLDDEIYRTQLRYEQSVFSHETALFLHNYFDRRPQQLSVTVKTGLNTKSLNNHGIKVYSIKRELYSLGLTTAKTCFGRIVNVYNIDRTICDIVRSRSKIDTETLHNALKIYVKHNNRNLSQLMDYAENFKIANILRNYLEVLL